MERGRLAELLDCYLGCECCGDDVICQIVLDKFLYDIDRAIDFYTLGSDASGNGEPERRAGAFARLILEFQTNGIVIRHQGQAARQPTCLASDCSPSVAQIGPTLTRIVALLQAALPSPLTQGVIALLTGELCLQQLSDRRLESVIATLAPGCVEGEVVLAVIDELIGRTIAAIGGQGPCAEPEITPPPTTQSSLRIFDRLDRLFPDGNLRS